MKMSNPTKTRIAEANLKVDKEQLYPYHFKGGSVTQLWQTLTMLEGDTGVTKIGLGTQSPLWADKSITLMNSESDANELMYAISERALQMVKGEAFETPTALINSIFEELYSFAKGIADAPNLNKSFVLNALVCVDNAAWLLHADNNDITTFDDLIPEHYQTALAHKHSHVASVPAFSVGSPIQDIIEAVDQGFYILKLKTGAAGTQQEMLDKDIAFFRAVHNAVGERETEFTPNNKIQYCLDPNGRYETIETLQQFLKVAEKMGALEQIAIFEEPLVESNESDVRGLGVFFAVDECARTHEDVVMRSALGYSAIAVKPIAKTLSKTLEVIDAAHQNNMACFCADLTVNPVLLDWNKCIAARLPSLPGLQVGFLENNGHQYYKNWNALKKFHPSYEANYTKIKKGSFELDQRFYAESGGIFLQSEHYSSFFK